MTDDEIAKLCREWPNNATQAARAIIADHQAKLLAGVEMPEACATYECDHDYAENTGLIDYKIFQGDPLVTGMHLFTKDQLQQYAAAQAREKALSEAKGVCIAEHGACWHANAIAASMAAQRCAAEIEKLKGGE